MGAGGADEVDDLCAVERFEEGLEAAGDRAPKDLTVDVDLADPRGAGDPSRRWPSNTPGLDIPDLHLFLHAFHARKTGAPG